MLKYACCIVDDCKLLRKNILPLIVISPNWAGFKITCDTATALCNFFVKCAALVSHFRYDPSQLPGSLSHVCIMFSLQQVIVSAKFVLTK